MLIDLIDDRIRFCEKCDDEHCSTHTHTHLLCRPYFDFLSSERDQITAPDDFRRTGLAQRMINSDFFRFYYHNITYERKEGSTHTHTLEASATPVSPAISIYLPRNLKKRIAGTGQELVAGLSQANDRFVKVHHVVEWLIIQLTRPMPVWSAGVVA